MSSYESAGIEKGPSPLQKGEPFPATFLLPEKTIASINDAIDIGDRMVTRSVVEEGITSDWIKNHLVELDQTLGNKRFNPILVPALVAQGLVEQFSGSQEVRNIITERVGYDAALHFRHLIPRSLKQLDAMIEGAGWQLSMIQTKPGARQSAARSVLMVGSEIKSAFTFRNALDSYEVRHRERKELELLRLENDGLFEHTRFLQRYQLKPALVKASGVGNIRDWMVIDWNRTREELAEQGVVSDSRLLDATPGTLARFFGTRHEFVADKPVFERHGTSEYSTIRVNFADSIKGKGEGADTPDIGFQLSNDGHLLGLRGISLKTYAEQIGKSDQYELLRGEILAIYSDLVLPAYLVHEATELENEVLPAGIGKSRAVDIIRKLVLARTRLVQNDPERVKREMKKESRKKPDEHSVIGFIRDLPKGYRASYEAREACRKYLGRDLAPEGETYVIEHKRGGSRDGAGEYTGHRAIRRNVGASLGSLVIQNSGNETM
jgi:hypothetical protein